MNTEQEQLIADLKKENEQLNRTIHELHRKVDDLLEKMRVAIAKLNNYLDDDGNEFCITTGEYKGDCSCPDCWPEGQESDNVGHDY